eukprot:683142-Rhodomonas_salina.21
MISTHGRQRDDSHVLGREVVDGPGHREVLAIGHRLGCRGPAPGANQKDRRGTTTETALELQEGVSDLGSNGVRGSLKGVRGTLREQIGCISINLFVR